MSQIDSREEQGSSVAISPADLEYLTANGLVLRTTKEDHDKGVDSVARLSQLNSELSAKKAEEEQTVAALRTDQQKEHSILLPLEGKGKKEELEERIQDETTAVSKEESELNALEANVNELIQMKSTIDRMMPYGAEYLSLTDLGVVALSDLHVRSYRVADQELLVFLAESKAIDTELRSIADRSSSYVGLLKSRFSDLVDEDRPATGDESQGPSGIWAPSVLWSTSIGLAKLQGDTNQVGERFIQALGALQSLKSTTPNKLMAAEIMTASSNQDLQSLESVLKDLDKQLRSQHVPEELSTGVAATIMAGRRYDGTYPLDRFAQFRQLTQSYEAAAILSAMNISYDDLSGKFQLFKSRFNAWGYMESEDTEIASAFLAIGELSAAEVDSKMQYIIEQLKNYLEYPLVAAAILSSIPVFESHEVLDLMEKAVHLLSAYARGLEQSELVALAVRMIHGVRNELVKEIDSTAKMAATPVQFVYAPHPGLFFWYFPVIVAHSSYHATFSGMGGFHPAHSHGIGGFAG